MDIAIMNYSTAEITTITGCPDEWENEQIEEYLFKKLNLKESEIHYMCAKSVTNKTEKYRPLEVWPLLEQFQELKVKHPDALLLFRCGDFYETYMQDAEKSSKILGITLTKSSKTKDPDGKPLAMAGFPYHALDTYLPKLIRAGQRVAICDQIEAPKQTAKRGISEMVTSGASMEKEQKTQPKEDQAQGFHR